jgi:rod shape-determining protein MreC
MLADRRTEYLQGVRSTLAIVVTPLQVVASAPDRVGDWIRDAFTPEESVREAYNRLRGEHMRLKARLQRMQALEAENAGLRHLLAAAEKVPDQVLMAELVDVSLDPYTHKLIVNRGVTDGIYVGQPVLDPHGVMGQVTETMPFTSAVTLVTDPSHATPVHVERNDLRAIAFGTGRADELKISYLTHNADIKIGDVLVTSGMGGRFPAGYPVARVREIVRDASEAFLRITATPVARLERSKQVLLVWQGIGKEVSADIGGPE